MSNPGLVRKIGSSSERGEFLSSEVANIANNSKNYIMNGNFDIWQRNTSFTWGSGTRTFTADRFNSWNNGGGGASTSASRQTGELVGSRYHYRGGRASGNTATGSINVLSQELDRDDVIALRGKTVTLSFYIRRGSTVNGTSSVSAILSTGTGAESQTTLSGYTGQINVINQAVDVTTSFVRYALTATLGSNITTLGLRLQYVPSGTADANEYVEVSQVMLNEGSTAQNFSLYAKNISGELAACQRYYETLSGSHHVTGAVNPSWQSRFTYFFKVMKRSTPTVAFTYTNQNNAGLGASSVESTSQSSATLLVNANDGNIHYQDYILTSLTADAEL